MQATLCPPKSALADYLAGKLQHDDSDVIEMHLEQCTDCEQAATELEGTSDSVIAALKSAPSSATERDIEHVFFGWQGNGNQDAAAPKSIGAYELIKPLGAGAMGAVYLARHRNLEKECALKLLPYPVAAKSEFVTRFQREVTTTARLDHPAIVRATDAGNEGGIHFLAMDAISGADLATVFRCTGKVNCANAAEIGRQVALGLAHAHSLGVDHRDIKPSNLMLDSRGQIKILDFGLAQLGFWQSDTAEITTVGQLMGTLDYMAPEQAERGGAVDYRADLYSLGATLFKLLTGHAVLSPAPDLTPIEKLRLLSTHNAPKLKTLRADIDPAFAKLVDDLLAKDPARRPASAAHLAEMLEPFCKEADLERLTLEASTENAPPRAEVRWTQTVGGPLERGSSNSPTQAKPPVESTNKQARSWSGGLGWAVAAMVTTMLVVAGILFVLETSKGQLVIESFDADVDIRVVAEGEQTSQALHIEPGTQSTKLRGGKYSIVIDSPSDGFTVTNGEFTIRRGATVVARIKSVELKDANEFGEKVARPLYDESDKRLDELVYQGDTLDTWLRRLRFERDANIVADSLRAISSLASKDLEPIIRPVLMEYLRREGVTQSGFAPLAVNAIARATESEFLNAITPLLRDQHEPEWVFQAALLNEQPRIQVDSEGLSAFIAWMEERMEEAPGIRVGTLEGITFYSRHLLTEESNVSLTPNARQTLVEFLDGQSAITDRNFWLANTNEPHYAWCNELKKVVTRRALVALSREDIDEQGFINAAAALDSCLGGEFELDFVQREQLRAAVKRQLMAVRSIERQDLALTSGVLRHALRARSLTHADAYVTNDSRKGSNGNLLISALNLVALTGDVGRLKEELQRVHQLLRETALNGDFHSAGWASNLPTRFLYLRSEVGKDTAEFYGGMRQLLFLQTGYLVGYEEKQLQERFDELRPADRRERAEKLLGKLESNNRPEVSEALQASEYLLGPGDSPRSVEVLKRLLVKLSENAPDRDGRVALLLLSRVTGDSFVGELAQCLAQSENPIRIFASLENLYEIKEFRCGSDSDPEQQEIADKGLQAFFQWLDNEPSARLRQKGWYLLKGLLRDRSGLAESFDPKPYQVPAGVVSQASQNLILDYLAKQADFGAGYWLEQINSQAEPSSIPYGELFEKEQLRRSLNLIESLESEELKKLYAFLCISNLCEREFFTDAVRSKVLDAVRRELESLGDTDSLAKKLQVTSVDSSYLHVDEPEVAELQISYSFPSHTQPWASLPIICLNLVESLNARVELQSQLEALHQAVAKISIRRSYFPEQGRSWDDSVERAMRADDISGMLAHVLLVQSGKMLNLDVDELLQRPERLVKEERERKRRFVQPGDTLAIYIPGLLPTGNVDPPVMQAGTRDPVVGFPVPVNAQGNITLPFIGIVDVAGSELAEVKAKITKINVEKRIFKGNSHTVFFLMRANERLEIRNISGASAISK